MTTNTDSQAQVVQDPDDELEQQEEGAEETTTEKKGCLRSRRAKILLLVATLISLCICCLGLIVARTLFTGDSAVMAPGGAIDTPEPLAVFWDNVEKCPANANEGGFRFEQPRIERDPSGNVKEIVFAYGRPNLPEEADQYVADFGGTSQVNPEKVQILDAEGTCWTARLEFAPLQGASGPFTVYGVRALDTATNSPNIHFPAR